MVLSNKSKRYQCTLLVSTQLFVSAETQLFSHQLSKPFKLCFLLFMVFFSLSLSPVPLVLLKCAEVIEKNGIVDGIYRLSGMSSNIQKLRYG